jgi:murein DD-endopeptidase MepM/ murein hydrolase activator NlpD
VTWMRYRRMLKLPVVLLVLAGCGSAPAASPPPVTPGVSSPSVVASPPSPPPSQPPSSPAAASAPPSPAPATTKYAFPVIGKASYAHTHHDYPASDIIAACGLTAVSPVDGTVLEVTRVDRYQPKVNAGETRGGLSVSILGADGVRYYTSHFSSIDAGVEPGARVTAGRPIAKVGRTGDAGACHVHFGLSPACAKTGDWWNRRGVLYPWAYLDAWRAGKQKSPAAEVTAWQRQHGCPTRPASDA